MSSPAAEKRDNGGLVASGNVATKSTSATKNIEEENAVNPITDFITTSSVIETINAALAETMKDPSSSSSSSSSSRQQPQEQQQPSTGYFELQKRLPDGSARKATEEEITSADMKNKLEQAAQFTSKMSTEQKIEWAHKQRQSGNALYQQGKYKEAIDIYLTCLIVRDTSANTTSTTTTTTKNKDDDTDNDDGDGKKAKAAVVDNNMEALILPVMNNLAQCSLQLGWYHKAELFCTLALEALEGDAPTKPHKPSLLVAKLHFKRGRARRLRGWYDEARGDLERALVALGSPLTKDSAQKSAEQKALEKEFQLLEKAVAEGKKNKKRAKRAMQTVLGGIENKDTQQNPTTDSCSDTKVPSSKSESAAATKPTITIPLYHEKHARTHSTIRKRPEGPPPYERACLPVQLSYWQMYRLIAARVAQKILDIIGEGEGSSFGSTGATKEDTEKQD